MECGRRSSNIPKVRQDCNIPQMKKVARLRNPEEIASNTERMAVRTTGRIKKAKIVFDPSDNYLPRYQRTSGGSTTSNQNQLEGPNETSNDRRQKDEKPRVIDVLDENFCYICVRKEPKKTKNRLISCKDCEHKAHVTCLPLEFEDQTKLRENYRCNICQICSSCYEGPEEGELITCTKCVKSFHFSCHIPSMARFPTQAKWLCSKCTIPKGKSLLKVETKPIVNTEAIKEIPVPVEIQKINNVISIEKKPTPLPLTNGNKLLRMSPNDLCEITNVKSWTSNEVMEFFSKYFPEEAYVFKDHDIDGQSLLLMKRSDVVNKMAIKLGPALRIYNLILKIQSQSTDPTIGW